MGSPVIGILPEQLGVIRSYSEFVVILPRVLGRPSSSSPRFASRITHHASSRNFSLASHYFSLRSSCNEYTHHASLTHPNPKSKIANPKSPDGVFTHCTSSLLHAPLL